MCFGPLYWLVLILAAEMWAALLWNEGGESQWERNRERVTGWEGEMWLGVGVEVLGGVSRGSEWLECTLRLGEWAACWAGGYCRYCVEAAGVTVAVTDTKTTFHGRRHWLKAVARPLHTGHTLTINNHSFLWWIVYYCQCFVFCFFFFFCFVFAWKKSRRQMREWESKNCLIHYAAC